MSESETKMNILIEEANANYNANRYKDAARTFEHLITLAIQSDEPEEAIYFAYRAADSWRKDKNTVNRAVIFRDIGNLAYNFCSQIMSSYSSKTKKPEEKAKSLLLIGECLLAKNKQKAFENFKEAISIFEDLAEKAKEDRKTEFLRDALDAALKMDNKKLAKEYMIKIANFHVTNAENHFKKKTPEDLQYALRYYEDALDMYKELKMKEDIVAISKKIEDLKKKVAKYDPFST